MLFLLKVFLKRLREGIVLQSKTDLNKFICKTAKLVCIAFLSSFEKLYATNDWILNWISRDI